MLIKQSQKNKIIIDEVNISRECLVDYLIWFLEERLGEDINAGDIELTYVYEILSLFEGQGETVVSFKIKGGENKLEN